MSRPPRHFGEASHLEEEDFFRAKQIDSWYLSFSLSLSASEHKRQNASVILGLRAWFGMGL